MDEIINQSINQRRWRNHWIIADSSFQSSDGCPNKSRSMFLEHFVSPTGAIYRIVAIRCIAKHRHAHKDTTVNRNKNERNQQTERNERNKTDIKDNHDFQGTRCLAQPPSLPELVGISLSRIPERGGHLRCLPGHRLRDRLRATQNGGRPRTRRTQRPRAPLAC